MFTTEVVPATCRPSIPTTRGLRHVPHHPPLAEQSRKIVGKMKSRNNMKGSMKTAAPLGLSAHFQGSKGERGSRINQVIISF